MNFYTYSHASPEGNVFYIGKGKGDRAFSFGDRSMDWKRAVKKNGGVKIEILARWDTEQEAFEHEKFLIQCFFDLNFSMVNKTKGGAGPYGIKHTEESNNKRREKNIGYVHKIITCPKCNKSGGETSMKRWHFENCNGIRPYKGRITWQGKRIHVGKFHTREEAKIAEAMALAKLKESV